MKSILVPIGGSESDEAVLATALEAARPFASHLQFVHVHVGAGQAVLTLPHAGFAMGPALANVLAEWEEKARTRSSLAAQRIRDFCARAMIPIADASPRDRSVTASWHEEDGFALERIVFHARHSDLIVVGRARRPNGLPSDFIEQLLLGCGRPVLIAAPGASQSLNGTVMVCWRETADAARAVGAAMPFLTRAARVVVVAVGEKNEVEAAVNEAAQHLSRNGATAEARVIPAGGSAVAQLLATAADACAADLVVMGAYGHSQVREFLFGGCTQAFIKAATRPVLLMH